MLIENAIAVGPNYVLDEETVPDSVKDMPSSFGYGFQKRYRRRRFVFRWAREKLKKQLETYPAFVRDTSFNVKIRN